MRLASAFLISLVSVSSIGLVTAPASAGIVSDENAKPGIAGNWTAANDGTARFSGDVDLYPARWSISPGDPLALKVRSTSTYDVRIFRLGWYGGAGATEVKHVAGNPARVQPYPTPDPATGLAEARWDATVSVPDTASWTPGLYVARAEQPGGKQATTFFVVRDDKLPAKLPFLLVVGTATHQAYNAWPGPAGSGATSENDPRWIGKSLYGFNSGPTHPTESIGDLRQAVKVSFDRPYFVGGGTADVSVYEYPFVRWAEKHGYDFAIATDEDLHVDPNLLSGRKLVVFSGHEEYVSRRMFDHALAARGSGVNFLFLSGDTWSWQVRMEPGSGGGTSTLVGYKESWVRDPEQKIAYSLKMAGKIEEAKSHYQLVTRGWKNLEHDPDRGIDERRPGMVLTGVQSSGIIRDADGVGMHGGLYPWADLVVTAADHWLYAGTGLKNGHRVRNVFGYEVDSTLQSKPEFDRFRPEGQVILGAIRQVSDGTIKGSAAWFREPSGAEVVSMGAIYTSWALDDWGWRSGGFAAAGKENPVSPAYQQMMHNVIARYSDGVAPEFDAGPLLDAGIPDLGPIADADEIEKDVGPIPDTELVDVEGVGFADTSVSDAVSDAIAVDDAPAPNADPLVEDTGGDACGCSVPGAGSNDAKALAALAALGAAVVVARRRKGSSDR